jgi:putative ABC transport system permease protein
MARREARGQLRRLWPFVAAVAVGVGALVAINSFTENLQDTVRDQARALLGADLAFSSSRKFPPRADELIAELGRAAGGARAARVTSFSAMAYVPGTSGSRLVQVAAVEPGHPFYGRIETDPPGEWERLQEGRFALVDPSLLVALDARRGDTLALGEARFQIKGKVTSVPGDVGVRAAFGPRVFVPSAYLDETRLLVFGSRARYETFLKLDAAEKAQALADRYRPLLAAERVNTRTVSEDERSVRESMGDLGRYLGLVSLVAVLLGGLGVASAVHAFIKRRMETIAILRCLGASAGRVFAIYLTEAAAMGLAGSLAGAALGLAVQRVLPRLLADFLPVDVRLAPSWTALLSGLGVGAAVAVLFSLLPLLGVREVSPLVLLRRSFDPPARRRRDPWRILVAAVVGLAVVALAALQTRSLGVGAVFAGVIGLVLLALWLLALGLAQAARRFVPGRWPYVWRQGLANLHRPANQTVAVLLALGFGAFLLDTLFLVQHNLLRELRPGGSEARPNLVLFDIQPDQRAPLQAAARDAGLTTELVYGTLRWRRHLDWRLAPHLNRPLDKLDPWVRSLLRLTAYQLFFLDRVPRWAAVDEAVSLAKIKSTRPGPPEFVNAVLRALTRAPGAPPLPALPNDHQHPLYRGQLAPQDLVVAVMTESSTYWPEVSCPRLTAQPVAVRRVAVRAAAINVLRNIVSLRWYFMAQQ